jgi:hypothetical protein
MKNLREQQVSEGFFYAGKAGVFLIFCLKSC